MKKIFLATVILLFSGSLVYAQQLNHANILRQYMRIPHHQIINNSDAKSYTTKLDSITSQLFCLSWTYNNAGQIVEEVFRDNFDPNSYSWREVSSFDSSGNVIRIDMYYWNNGNWINSAYLEFEYNELGQQITSTNVNNFGGTWTIGGKGFYTYTASGKLAQYLQQINMGGTYEDLTRDDYYYSPNDKLEKVFYFYNQSGWDTTIKSIVTYTGDLVETYSEYLKENGFWENSTKYEWFYSAANNATQRDYFLQNTPTTWSSVQDRYEYLYDDNTNAANILFPFSSSYFSYDYEWFTMNNKRTEQDWYTIDVNTWAFMFVETQYYHYSPVQNLGVPVTDDNTELKIYPNPATESFSIQLPATETSSAWNLVITNMTGKVVKTVSVITGEEISVNDIPAGCYIVILSDKNGMTSSAKLIVK